MKKLLYILLVGILIIVASYSRSDKQREIDPNSEKTTFILEADNVSGTLDNEQPTGLSDKKIVIIEGVAFEFVLVKSGLFQMGISTMAGETDLNASQHWVRLTKDYYISKTEVTQEQYQVIMGNNPSRFTTHVATGETQKKRPVDMVSWNMISEIVNSVYKDGTFLKAINGKGQGTFRLPTEAEWEYAARGGHKIPTAYMMWPGTNVEADLGNYAWHSINSDNKTHEVAKKRPNVLGLYDMAGNVYEWCFDTWDGTDYDLTGNSKKNPIVDPIGTTGAFRVMRGGYWLYDGSNCRSACRYAYGPTNAFHSNGFRLVLLP